MLDPRIRLTSGLIAMLLGAAMAAHGAIYTVTNSNNSGGGSLRTALNNANGTPGSTVAFAIPTSDSRYNAGTGVVTIQITSTLPAITAAGTIVDGTTQTTAIGNTNAGTLGTGGTVGVDALTLATVQRPEIQIVDNGALALGLDIQASNVVIRGLCIYGFGATANSDSSADIRVGASASGALVERNVLGSSATSFTDPGAAARSPGDHVRVVGGDNGTLRNNLIGFSQGKGLELNSGSNGWLVEGNEMRRNGIGNANLDAIDIENGSGGATVRGNLLIQSDGCGADTYASSGTNTIVNNTSQGNGIGSGASLETAGIRIFGSGSVVDRNIVSGNVGAGVLVVSTSSTNRITLNSIYGNGATTGQIGIDLLKAADNVNLGTAPFVTPNDSGDADAGANGLFNFPVLESAVLAAGQLTLAGFARPGSAIEVFLAAADASGFGEGQTFLFTATEGGAQDLDATTGAYANPFNGLNQGSDSTNRFRFTVTAPGAVAIGGRLTATGTLSNNTSEFSGNVTVTGSPSVTLVKSVLPGGSRPPGTELTYSIVYANTGSAAAYSVVVRDDVPANTDFKLGSATSSPGSSGLTATIAYSNNAGSTWSYTPVSGGGGAAAGYDRAVNAVRWTFTGTLGSVSPSNQGNVALTARIR